MYNHYLIQSSPFDVRKLISVLAAPLENLLDALVYLFRFSYIKYRSSSIKDKITKRVTVLDLTFSQDMSISHLGLSHFAL